jgi:signal transduction histidine kinase
MNITLQLLHEDLRSKPQVSTARVLPRLDIVLAEVQRLQRILNDFLKLAKAPDLDLRERDPNLLIEEIEAFIDPELREHGIHLVTHLDRSVRVISVDPDLFRQALLNIIRNAIQAMPGGGTLTIQSRFTDGSFTISIIDTGEGMSDDVRKRVFDGFFSTRPGGTGIGLAITRQIIQLHGGGVICESAPGRGSKFAVSLPAGSPGHAS